MRIAKRTRFGSAGPEKKVGRSRRDRRRGGMRRALTLVELLVTISIMGLVVAVSIPVVKPMLASNKVKNGADSVAGFLGQARTRAIEEGRPVGVTFERVLNYKDNDSGAYPYNGASVIMRQVAEPRPLSGFVKDVRVAIDDTGLINFCVWSTLNAQWEANASEQQYWDKLVNTDDKIQFDAKGPKYAVSKSGSNYAIDMTHLENLGLPIPLHFDSDGLPQPVLFKIFRKPQPGKIVATMASPVAMPSGVVVDLDSSGMGMNFTDGSEDQDWKVVRDDFCAAGPDDVNSVTIMFSPTGEVDRVYFSHPTDSGKIVNHIPTGPIHLNIGIWERSGFWMDDGSGDYFISNDYLPDDAEVMRNYHDMNNFWVTVFPRTGAVRVNRVAAISPSGRYSDGAINASRKHAGSLHGPEAR